MIPEVVIQCALISVMAAAVVAVVFVIVLAVIAAVVIAVAGIATRMNIKQKTNLRRRRYAPYERETEEA